MTELQEKQAKLKEKNKKLAGIFEESKTEKGYDFSLATDSDFKALGTSQARAQRVEQMNNELTDLGKAIDALLLVEKMAKDSADREKTLNTAVNSVVHPAAGDGAAIGQGGQIIQPKSIGQQFIESKAYTDRATKQAAVLGENMHIKTLFETTAGWAPETTRTGRLVLDAQRPIQVIDIIPIGNTSQNAVVYMEETTFTNAAAEAAEGAAAAEATLVYTEQSSSVRKIAVFIPVTEEQMEDEARISSLLDNRLRFMIQQRLDLQILVGDGIAPNIDGINNVSGIQTQALGADPIPDAVYKAMTNVRVTGQAQPNAYVTHPNDWQQIRLLKTSDGIYIWGSPSEAGPERIWGIQAVQAQAQTENTGLVGDFANMCELVMRQGVVVKMSDSHDDYFTKGKMAIKATLRAALPVYRPAGFCTVTGI